MSPGLDNTGAPWRPILRSEPDENPHLQVVLKAAPYQFDVIFKSFKIKKYSV